MSLSFVWWAHPASENVSNRVATAGLATETLLLASLQHLKHAIYALCCCPQALVSRDPVHCAYQMPTTPRVLSVAPSVRPKRISQPPAPSHPFCPQTCGQKASPDGCPLRRGLFWETPQTDHQANHYGPWHGHNSAPQKGPNSGLVDAHEQNSDRIGRESIEQYWYCSWKTANMFVCNRHL